MPGKRQNQRRYENYTISLSPIGVKFPYLGTELNAVVTIHQWHNAWSTRQYREKKTSLIISIQDLKFVLKQNV